MEITHLDHPTEESLERYLLNDSREQELAAVETHILACEACVFRLETLGNSIAAMKLALRELQALPPAFLPRAAWRTWFELPSLPLAAVLGTLALGLAVVPQFTRPGAPFAVSLTAYRGFEIAVVPQGRRLHLHLDARDLPEGPVVAEVVDSTGSEIWKSTAAIQRDQLDLSLPSLTPAGAHFLRLYGTPQRDLLREFAFQVK